MTDREDKSMDVIMISVLAFVHGGFWLGVGLTVGRLLWGMP